MEGGSNQGQPSPISTRAKTRHSYGGGSSVSGYPSGYFEQHLETGGPEVKYLVVYEKSTNGWGAYAPDLPGLGVVGQTLEETKQLVREAIEFHLEGMRQHGEPIPVPSSETEYITV
jgi:predicted RNase H-like HicB family nuclease